MRILRHVFLVIHVSTYVALTACSNAFDQSQCNADLDGGKGMDLPGEDLLQVSNVSSDTCVKMCCDNLGCEAIVHVSSAKDTTLNTCVTGYPCCFMKRARNILPVKSSDPDIVSGKIQRPGTASTCNATDFKDGTDRPGSDMTQIIDVNVSTCAQMCCQTFGCRGYVYLESAFSNFGKCEPPKPCCFLKNADVAPVNSTISGISSGAVSRSMPAPLLIWNATVDESGVYSTQSSTPAVSTKLVFFGLGNSLYAVHRSNGQIAWRHATNGSVRTTPLLLDEGNRVVFGSFDGIVRCLNATTGSEMWSFESKDAVKSSPKAYQDAYVLFGSMDGNAYALDQRSGALVWSFNMRGPVFADAAIVDDGVIFGSVGQGADILTKLDAHRGSAIWQQGDNLLPFCSGGLVTSPFVSESELYLTCQRAGGHSHSDGGLAFALSVRPSDGIAIWNSSLGTQLVKSPVLNEGALFVSAGSDVVALESGDGSVRWRQSLGANLSPPLIDTDSVVVGTSAGNIVSLDLNSGEVTWALLGETSGVSASPARGDDGVIFVVTANSLLALKRPTRA